MSKYFLFTTTSLGTNFNDKDLLKNMHLFTLCAFVCVCRCLQRPEEGFGSPGTGATGG